MWWQSYNVLIFFYKKNFFLKKRCCWSTKKLHQKKDKTLSSFFVKSIQRLRKNKSIASVGFMHENKYKKFLPTLNLYEKRRRSIKLRGLYYNLKKENKYVFFWVRKQMIYSFLQIRCISFFFFFLNENNFPNIDNFLWPGEPVIHLECCLALLDTKLIYRILNPNLHVEQIHIF